MAKNVKNTNMNNTNSNEANSNAYSSYADTQSRNAGNNAADESNNY